MCSTSITSIAITKSYVVRSLHEAFGCCFYSEKAKLGTERISKEHSCNCYWLHLFSSTPCRSYKSVCDTHWWDFAHRDLIIGALWETAVWTYTTKNTIRAGKWWVFSLFLKNIISTNKWDCSSAGIQKSTIWMILYATGKICQETSHI